MKYDADSAREKISGMKGWNFSSDFIEKEYVFKNFQEAMSFMLQVSYSCERMNHHPDWTNVYNRLKIKLSTHDAGGVTDKDFKLADEIEKIYIERFHLTT